MDLAFAAPLGLIIGSFLNVVAYRLPRGESLVAPRSRCTSCAREVRGYDNVPVVSWLALRGRCRDCRAPISIRYPSVELLTAAVFGAGRRTARPERPAALGAAVRGDADRASRCIDLEHQIIPNRFLRRWPCGRLVASVLVRPHALPALLAAAGGALLLFLVVALIYPGGMGMGDVKLVGVMGLYLGISVVPALLIAFLSGSIVGVALMLGDGGDRRRRGVPFGPFLALGGLVGILAGPALMHAYAATFLH